MERASGLLTPCLLAFPGVFDLCGVVKVRVMVNVLDGIVDANGELGFTSSSSVKK